MKLLIFGLVIFASTRFADARQLEVTARTFLPAKYASEESDGKPPAWRYLLHLPEGYKKSEKPWPMIFFLHGRSIRGNDLATVKRYGPPAFLDKKPHFPFVVVSPQLPGHSWPSQSLLELLDEVTSLYNVDRSRIYLTGVSMGGGGAWYLAAADQKRFAALAPLCGYGGIALAGKLDDLPIWAFHGLEDDIVSIEPHRKLVEAVNQAGGSARLTEIPGGDHGNIIFPTYKRDDLYQWFLSHSRGEGTAASGTEVKVENHTVKKGETLWRISHEYGITVEQLKNANGLQSAVLQIGQKLTIPQL
ncbi:MAG: LysM peptidoglycan-binding domain-containing protein [Verrucomicrobiales bacterium]|nr:LysM peptidoglycan-binding domain-containing protein [Verrucomicrobiales bacterium]